MTTQMEIYVVPQEEDYPSVIAKHIAIHAPIQVLVTGPGAYNLFRNHQQLIMSALGPGWACLGPPPAPTSEDARQWVQSIAETVRENPDSKHIWFGPTDDHDVRRNLFCVVPSKPYRAGIYVLGLLQDPLRYMTGLSVALNEPGRAVGELVSIFSLPDSLITQQVREKLLTALKQGSADKVAYEYMQFLERLDAQRLANQLRSVTGEKKWWQFWKR